VAAAAGCELLDLRILMVVTAGGAGQRAAERRSSTYRCYAADGRFNCDVASSYLKKRYALTGRLEPETKLTSPRLIQYDPAMRKRVCGLSILALLWMGGPVTLAQEVPESRVLVIYPQEREMAIFAGLDNALRSALQSDAKRAIEFYTEYLDLIRFPGAQHRQKTVD
jgi:hypothetical protein